MKSAPKRARGGPRSVRREKCTAKSAPPGGLLGPFTVELRGFPKRGPEGPLGPFFGDRRKIWACGPLFRVKIGQKGPEIPWGRVKRRALTAPVFTPKTQFGPVGPFFSGKIAQKGPAGPLGPGHLRTKIICKRALIPPVSLCWDEFMLG